MGKKLKTQDTALHELLEQQHICCFSDIDGTLGYYQENLIPSLSYARAIHINGPDHKRFILATARTYESVLETLKNSHLKASKNPDLEQFLENHPYNQQFIIISGLGSFIHSAQGDLVYQLCLTTEQKEILSDLESTIQKFTANTSDIHKPTLNGNGIQLQISLPTKDTALITDLQGCMAELLENCPKMIFPNSIYSDKPAFRVSYYEKLNCFFVNPVQQQKGFALEKAIEFFDICKYSHFIGLGNEIHDGDSSLFELVRHYNGTNICIGSDIDYKRLSPHEFPDINLENQRILSDVLRKIHD